MRQSINSTKPDKPHPDYPLFAHQTGQWAKKVRGKMHYFGAWSDPQAALDKWLKEKDDLLAGRTPREKKEDGLTLRDLVNSFLTSKRHLVDSGEIKQRTWDELDATCGRLIQVFGKDRLVTDLLPDDFEILRANIAYTWGPTRLGNEIQRVRSVFKFAWDAVLIDAPVRFGPGFRKPSRKVLRKLRAEKGLQMFEAKDVHDLMDVASLQVRAMILLGVNAGYGNEDCASLPISALDLDGGWVRFARPKTGIDRKCKLWPETVQALRDVLAARREPTDSADSYAVFITKYRRAWKNGPRGNTALTFEMRKLLIALEINRPGLNFYSFRRTFRTIADEAGDQPAVDFIMGHSKDEEMATRYRQKIDDKRLAAVSDYVRRWLFVTNKPKKATVRLGKI